MNITPDAWQADTEALRARVARLEAQSDIRGRAVAIHRVRAREAEARIKAVRDVLDRFDGDMGLPPLVSADVIRRALDGEG